MTGHLSASHLPYLSRTSSARDHQNQPPSPVFATLSHGRLLLLLLLLLMLLLLLLLLNYCCCCAYPSEGTACCPTRNPPLPPCLPAFDSIVCAAALKTDGRHVISTPSHTRYNSRAETDSSVCPALPQTTLLFSELISDDDPYDDDTSILMY